MRRLALADEATLRRVGCASELDPSAHNLLFGRAQHSVDLEVVRSAVAAAAASPDREGGARILLAFSGPAGRTDSIAAFLGDMGDTADERDVEIDPEAHDLLDRVVWEELLGQLPSFGASLWAPPCSTFSASRGTRTGERHGPPPLRSADDIHGLPGLRGADKEKVRVGTALALQTAQALKKLTEARAPWIFETPWPRSGQPSITALPEMSEALSHSGVRRVQVDQCVFGAPTTKPTLFAMHRVEISEEERSLLRCCHPGRWWRRPPDGARRWGAHPSLRGKVWEVPEERWSEDMRRLRPGRDEPWLTRGAAAYPGNLNAWLAAKLHAAACATRPSSDTADRAADSGGTAPAGMVRVGRWANTLVRANAVAARQPSDKLQFASRLRPAPPDAKAEAERLALGGMRTPAAAVSRLRSVAHMGAKIRDAFFSMFDENPDMIRRALEAVGSSEADAAPPATYVEMARRRLARAVGCSDADAAALGFVGTQVRAGLLGAWRLAAGDPDDQPELWLREGGPAGVRAFPEHRGVYPPVDDETPADPEELVTLFDEQVSASPDDEDFAQTMFRDYEAKGYVRGFDSADELATFLGEEPVLSRVHVLTKERLGKTKRRLILDCKRSGLTDASRKAERALLPRAVDVVDDIMSLECDADEGEGVQLLVLDFSDAFWQIPLHPTERRFFTARVRNRWYAFLRAAQGSRGAPLLWGRTVGLVMRLTQGVYPPRKGRIECYVDDPVACFAGTALRRAALAALTVYLWLALGFALSFGKGQWSPAAATWTSASFAVSAALVVDSWGRRTVIAVDVAVKEELVQDLIELSTGILRSNVCAVKRLRTYLGKATHVASLVKLISPFLHRIWAALNDEGARRAPDGCVWTEQIAPAVGWILSFCKEEQGTIARRYDTDRHAGRGDAVDIICDASPFGFGAVLVLNGRPKEYLAETISTDDSNIFQFAVGDCKGQQTWEALCILIALRAWSRAWRDLRFSLRVRSDSVSALTMVLKCKSAGRGSALIAAELALDIAHTCYRPDIAEHLPGVCNTWADALSRMWDPAKRAAVPAALAALPRATVPPRPREWYRTLRPPVGHPGRLSQAPAAR